MLGMSGILIALVSILRAIPSPISLVFIVKN
jgi:hypothetical protein